MITRRNFVRGLLRFTLGLAGAASVATVALRKRAMGKKGKAPRWAFLVDTYKCVGCGFCVKACKMENDIPYDAYVTRTWVERYVLTKSGEVLADTPHGGRDGFTTSKVQLGLGHDREVKPEEIAKAFFCTQAVQPVRKPAVCSSMPGGCHISNGGWRGVG